MLPSVGCHVRRGLYISSGLSKGHSKWQNIRATKGKNDLLKSQAMNALLKRAKAAAARGGYDLRLNKELANLEQECRSKGLPLDTFRKFLVKLKEKPEVEVTFNVVGPSGTFFIIEAETDSVKGLEYTLRKYFNKVGGFRFATEAAAVQSWFEQKGILNVKAQSATGPVSLETIEEIGIELDCEDVFLVEEEDRFFELVCDARKLTKVERALLEKGLAVESAELQFRPTHPIHVETEDALKVEKLYSMLQEDDSIRQIYDNILPTT